jgi:hypothetical protein
MKLKEFKLWFAEFAQGIPVEGPNSAQWRKLQAIVESVEEPAPVAVKAPVEKK